ncbi:AAA family ATPase [Pseudomonas putida]|uniref:AAA family ATPase n=1 Tax=Pseudomonas putida TaxID=303 RepID=UPI00335EE27E
MRLDSLKIKNFRCYESAEFKFNPNFNLLIGVNGSGKTSLLQAVASSFVEFSEAIGHPYCPNNEEVVRVVVQNVEKKVRFEECYPLQLDAEGELLGRTRWHVKKIKSTEPVTVGYVVASHLADSFLQVPHDPNAVLPILAFYRANRRWVTTDVEITSAMTERPSRLDAYHQWQDAAVDIEDLQRWVISKTLENLQHFAETGSQQDAPNDELSIVNTTISKALPGAKGIRYDITLRSLMVDIGSSAPIAFNNLSDGQRSMIALLADIARRMCLLNPHLSTNVLVETAGIIVIDELDIHLHPAWQRMIVQTLKAAFPKVQFIAASHSPQIIGTLKAEEVIILEHGEASHPRVTYGLDSSSILSEVMDVEKRDPDVQALLTALFTSIESNELNTAKAKLIELKEKAPDLPEFAGAEALIRRKEILGK